MVRWIGRIVLAIGPSAMIAGPMMMATPAGAQQPPDPQACLQAVEQFAEVHGLTAEPPQATITEQPRTATELPAKPLSERLAESGGVLAPPPTGATIDVIEPPRPGPGGMPTMPDIVPDPGQGAAPVPEGSPMGLAAARTRMESLVMAARASAEEGDAVRCAEQLAQAQDIASDLAEGGGR